MFYKRCLFTSFIGSLIIFVIGMTIMPQTGGDIPIGESPDTFYENQRKEILNSRGFKMAIAGAAIAILILILLVRNRLHEGEIADAREEREAKRVRVVPYPQVQAQATLLPQAQAKPLPQTQAKPQVKPLPQKKLEELKEIIVVTQDPKPQHVTYELSPVRHTGQVTNPYVPRMSMPPRAQVLLRTFKYPPPYEAFNKK